MTEMFDPIRVQGDYLRETNFRGRLKIIATVRNDLNQVGIAERQYLRSLMPIFSFLNWRRDMSNDWVLDFADFLIRAYDLGDPIRA